MRRHHVAPEEAVRIFEDLGADAAFAHHWGVFRLTDEPREEPPKRLAMAIERARHRRRRVCRASAGRGPALRSLPKDARRAKDKNMTKTP